MLKYGYNSVPIPGLGNQGRRAESGTVTTETGCCADPGKVPAGGHSRIYTSGFGVQHTEYDPVTVLRLGPSNKDSDSRSGISPYMLRYDEAVEHDKLCKRVTTTG